MNFEMAVRKAQTLGTEMARLGFRLQDNPYTDLNPKLEASWSESYAKYCAMLSLARLGPSAPAKVSATPRRGEARARAPKREPLYAVR